MLALAINSTTLAQNQPQNSNQDEPIKIETTLINVPIVANDKDGQYIRDLKQEDFVVYEDGKKQEIDFFSSETVPLNVVLLIDMSTSTNRNSYAIKQAAKAFIENIRPKDKAKLVAFTYNINELNDFTDDKETLNHAIEKLATGGSTRLYDAVEYSARVIFSKIQGRKALILLTDGVDSSSYFSPSLAIREIVETDTLVYVVKYPVYPNHLSPITNFLLASNTLSKNKVIVNCNYDKSFDFLKELAEQTGGEVVAAPSFALLAEKMKTVAEQLRHIYSLGYYPSNPIQNGGHRIIEIKLHKRKATLHHKKGYDASVIANKTQNSPNSTN
jgi:VWFA-related protein